MYFSAVNTIRFQEMTRRNALANRLKLTTSRPSVLGAPIDHRHSLMTLFILHALFPAPDFQGDKSAGNRHCGSTRSLTNCGACSVLERSFGAAHVSGCWTSWFHPWEGIFSSCSYCACLCGSLFCVYVPLLMYLISLIVVISLFFFVLLSYLVAFHIFCCCISHVGFCPYMSCLPCFVPCHFMLWVRSLPKVGSFAILSEFRPLLAHIADFGLIKYCSCSHGVHFIWFMFFLVVVVIFLYAYYSEFTLSLLLV